MQEFVLCTHNTHSSHLLGMHPVHKVARDITDLGTRLKHQRPCSQLQGCWIRESTQQHTQSIALCGGSVHELRHNSCSSGRC